VRPLALPELTGASTLSDRLYDVLEEAVITGAFEAGQRLNADDLAKHFGISRIPVREALRALDANGWIELRPRHGAYVRQRTDNELNELFEVRLLLEAESARLAAQRRTERQLEHLSSIVDAGRAAAAAGGDAEVTRLNTEFHTTMAACAHNDVLASLLEGLSKRVRFYFSAAVNVRGKESVEEHALLVDALRAHDAASAAHYIQEHIRSTRAAVAAELPGA